MSVLLNIPSDLCRVICSEWLIDEDLIKLDCATCSKSMRPTLLVTLTCLLPMRSVSFSVNFVMWVNARNIRMSNFHLHKKLFSPGSNLLLNVNTDHVVELLVTSTGVEETVSIVNRFRNTTTLEIGSSFLSSVSSGILEQLIALSVENDAFASAFLCNELLLCRNLRYIHLGFPSSTEFVFRKNKDIQTSLIAQNPLLEGIEITACTDVLESIVEHCHHIIRVVILTDRVVLPHLTRALSECRYLEWLYVHDDNGTKIHFSVCEETGHRSLILHDYNDLDGKAELVSSVPGLHIFDSEGPIHNPEVRALVANSLDFLLSLSIRRGRHLTHTALVDILKCKKLTTLVLESVIDDDLVLNAFLESPPLLLETLSLRIKGVTSLTVFTVIRMCERLTKVFFNGVVENAPEVHNLVNYLRDGEGKHRKGLVCDIEFRSGAGLYFAEGRLGGTDVNQYLTQSEIETNVYYDSDEGDA